MKTSLRIYLAAEPLADISRDPGRETAAQRSERVDKKDIPDKGKSCVIISFCIPTYGVMFRCRVVSALQTLTATTALTALRFVERSLDKVKPKKITLVTDSPAFYFSVSSKEKADSKSGSREDLFEEYRSKLQLEFALIERNQNPARNTCDGLPCAPSDIISPLKFIAEQWPTGGKLAPPGDGLEL